MSADGGAETLPVDEADSTTPLCVRFEDCAVCYKVIGGSNSPWLVICHGMALNHREFMDTARQLADRWRVLLWDMPGHGASRPAPARFSLDGMTDALEAVMKAADVERPVLLGFRSAA